MIFARATRDFGTNADIAIFSDYPHVGMAPVPSIVANLLCQLISKGSQGIKISALHSRDLTALHEIETKLGIRLSRTRSAGHVALVNTVRIVDQRNHKEAA